MEDKKKGDLLPVRSLGKTFFSPQSGFKIWAICPLRAHKTPLIFKKRGVKNVPWYSEVPFVKCQIIIWFQLQINYMQPQRSVPSNPGYLTLNPGCKVKHMLDKETHLRKRKLCQRRMKIIFQAAHCNYLKSLGLTKM